MSVGWGSGPDPFVHGALALAQDWNDIRDMYDYLEGYQAGQESIELDAPLQVTPGIGSAHSIVRRGVDGMDETVSLARTLLRASYVADAGATFRFVAQKATAPATGDRVDWLFVLRKADGTEEVLARMRAQKDGSAGQATLLIATANSGTIPSTAAWCARSLKRNGIKNNGPNATLDVGGDINSSGTDAGFIGLRLWDQNPGGTQYFAGSAEVSGQIHIGATTGTPPVVAGAGSPMVKNGHAEFLQGKSWAGAPSRDADSVSVVSPLTDYTVAAEAAPEDGLYMVTADLTVTLAAGDVGASFTFGVPGRARTVPRRGQTSGQRIPVATWGIYRAAAAEVLELQVRKDIGSGSSTVAGAIQLTRIAA